MLLGKTVIGHLKCSQLCVQVTLPTLSFGYRTYLDIIDLTSEPSCSEEEADLPQAVVTCPQAERR